MEGCMQEPEDIVTQPRQRAHQKFSIEPNLSKKFYTCPF